jgi:hypothetical protein
MSFKNNYYFLVKSSNYIFELAVRFNTNKEIWIEIGHNKLVCISSTLYWDDPIVYGNFVKYSIDCAVCPKTGLVKGKGTIEMIKANRSFIIQFCELMKKPISGFLFQDQSNIECNGKVIELSSMSLVKKGITWYQKHFGARPYSMETNNYDLLEEENLSKVIDKLKTDKMLEFYKFAKQYIDQANFKNEEKLYYREILEPIYNSSDSYYQFIMRLDCDMLYQWLHYFIQQKYKVLPYGAYYFISLEKAMDNLPRIKYVSIDKVKMKYPTVQQGGHRIPVYRQTNFRFTPDGDIEMY